MKIRIRECKTDGREWFSTHRIDNFEEAIERAIHKHFSRKHNFYLDSGLPNDSDTRYGQIGYYLPSAHASTMTTGRVRIDANPRY